MCIEFLSQVSKQKNAHVSFPVGMVDIFLMALAGQSSQGRTPTRPRDKRDKMAILLWNSTGNGRFVSGTGPGLSQGRVPFVPDTVPAQNVYVHWFFLSRSKEA